MRARGCLTMAARVGLSLRCSFTTLRSSKNMDRFADLSASRERERVFGQCRAVCNRARSLLRQRRSSH